MITPPTRAYLLIGYPRTGSSVLAQALAATGVLGIPQEYFWRGLEARHATEMGLPAPTDETYPPYLGAALRFGTTPNGVFGAKLFWAHAQDLVRRVGLMEEFSHLSPLERVWAPFRGRPTARVPPPRLPAGCPVPLAGGGNRHLGSSTRRPRLRGAGRG